MQYGLITTTRWFGFGFNARILTLRTAMSVGRCRLQPEAIAVIHCVVFRSVSLGWQTAAGCVARHLLSRR